MDAQCVAYLAAVEAGNEAEATAILDRMFDDYGQALGETVRRLDEAAEATRGLFEAASELVAEYS